MFICDEADPPAVVKVGGSLLDHPGLAAGLRAFERNLCSRRTLLVVGGGPVADAVRDFDRIHRLGAERSHWLALSALRVTGELARGWYPDAVWVADPAETPAGVHVLDALEFCRLRPEIPHTWDVTSDAIAAFAARAAGGRLVLLKSVAIPAGTPWAEAAARGWVDAHFPVAAAGLAVEPVEFRNWLDRHFPSAVVG